MLLLYSVQTRGSQMSQQPRGSSGFSAVWNTVKPGRVLAFSTLDVLFSVVFESIWVFLLVCIYESFFCRNCLLLCLHRFSASSESVSLVSLSEVVIRQFTSLTTEGSDFIVQAASANQNVKNDIPLEKPE